MAIPEYDILAGAWDTGQSNKLVRFSTEAVLDPVATEEAGTPKYKDVDYVEFLIPGDKYNRPKRPMNQGDRQELAAAYKAWKDGQSARQQGMPITELPGVAQSQVRELQYLNVHTVETLAQLPDNAATSIGSLFSLREKARNYLTHAKQGAEAEKIAKEKEALERRNRELEERLAKLEAAQVHPKASKSKE